MTKRAPIVYTSRLAKVIMSPRTARKYISSSPAVDLTVEDYLPAALKYKLYTDSVQSPSESIDLISRIYTDNFGKKALSLREDFCGTFQVGCEWVKSDPQRTAFGIDLDPEPLSRAKKNIAKLKAVEKKRASLCRQDVRVPTIPRVDIISAENFSFYIFKKRAELISYFRSAFLSLNQKGVLTLDMIGGPDFIKSPSHSQRTLNCKETGLASPVVYRWRQQQFNAVTNEGLYSIDFKIGGNWHKNVFTYDWRVWTIPEVTEALKDVGFSEVKVYWEEDTRKGSVLKPVSRINSSWDTWLCIVTGIK